MHRRFSAVVTALVAAALVVVACPVPAFADEVRDDQWHLDALGIDKAHELSQGEGITIGVIDSGIDASHPDLEGSIEAGKSFGDATGDGLTDMIGHGTRTSSLIVGHGHGDGNSEGVIGVAPKAEVISVAAHWDKPENYNFTDMSDSIRWLTDNGADIISISMGANSADHEGDAAVEYATSKGVPVVAAAGNDVPVFDEILGEIDGPKITGWPARAKGAIPVTGTTKDNKFWGDSLTLEAASVQPQLGISAPAEKLMHATEGGGYDDTKSGTSLSVPIVTGTLALIKSAYPELTFEQLMERLTIPVDDKGPKGYDDKFGWGIVNPYKALTEDVKHYKGGTSTQDEMVPLDQQGKDQGSDKDGKGSQNSDGALTAATSSSWFIPTVIAVAAILAAATIFIIIATKRRTKTRPPPTPSIT